MPFHLEMRICVSRETRSSKRREGLVFDLESVYLLWIFIRNITPDNSDLQAKLQGVWYSADAKSIFHLFLTFGFSLWENSNINV